MGPAVDDDDGVVAIEPGFDAPPRFRDADERRMNARAYVYWASLLQGRALPSPADLDLVELGGFAPHSVLLEIAVGGGDAAPVLRFVGPRLRAPAAPGAAAAAGDLPEAALVAQLIARVPQVLAARAPVGFADEIAVAPGSELLCRGVLLPLASDGEAIDLIHGVVSWTQVVSPEMARRLAAEIGGLVRVTRGAAPPAIDPFA
jgi:hypothetical protein